jgi:multiple antibiotic resistance protein
MHSTWQSFVLTFVPLFIVLDALGVVPFLTAISEGMSRREQRKTINLRLDRCSRWFGILIFWPGYFECDEYQR